MEAFSQEKVFKIHTDLLKSIQSNFNAIQFAKGLYMSNNMKNSTNKIR